MQSLAMLQGSKAVKVDNVQLGQSEAVMKRSTFQGSALERMLDFAILQESYDVPVNRNSEIALEKKQYLECRAGYKNQQVAGFITNGELENVLVPWTRQTLRFHLMPWMRQTLRFQLMHFR